jgi:hypothetical protein
MYSVREAPLPDPAEGLPHCPLAASARSLTRRWAVAILMRRAVAQTSITASFLVASTRELERCRELVIQPEDADAVVHEVWAYHAPIYLLLVRQQDELQTVLRTLRPEEREPFCKLLSELLVEVAITSEIIGFRDALVQERSDVESAVKVLCSFCERLYQDGLVGEEIDAFVDSLQRLDLMSEFITIHDLDAISWALPNSRKTRGDFFWRVHFAALLVGAMVRVFGRPHYRLVADTINALLEASDPVTEGSVRDAWRSRAGTGRFAAVHSD